MNLILEIRPDALTDIESASDWYEEKEPGLGSEYIREMRTSIVSLVEGAYHHPIRYPRLHVRWFSTRRFPYRIVYRIDDKRVIVLAVLHTARHNRAWRKRV